MYLKYGVDSEKLENYRWLEAARIVTGLTLLASRESLYFETGWEQCMLPDNDKTIVFKNIGQI